MLSVGCFFSIYLFSQISPWISGRAEITVTVKYSDCQSFYDIGLYVVNRVNADCPSSVALAARSTGLDVGRCLAMLVVLFAHGVGWIFLQGPYDFSPLIAKLDLGAYYSVTFFFALTGFLAGKALLVGLVGNPSPTEVGRFVARRWLRTLPVYYVVLMGVYAVQGWTSGNWFFDWNCVFFLQNFHDAAVGFFPTSWYMAVEQWAYLLLPVAVLGLPNLLTRRGMAYPRALLLTLLGVIAFFLFLRVSAAVLWVLPDRESYDMGIRKQVHLQLDALLYGLMVAQCKLMRPDWYKKLSSGLVFLLVAGLLLLVALFQYKSHMTTRLGLVIPYFVVHVGFGMTAVSVLLALTLPFLDMNPLNQWLCRWPWMYENVMAGSRYSYAVYLVHYTIMEKLYNFLPIFRPVDAHPALEIAMQCALMAFGIWLSFALARWLYFYVEVPAMRLRKCL